ncbi:NACHT domain-containing protein [Roseofilum reptotaenium CS-1145]|uniref:NACHT domain-containing protein n=1 Tax=Roseofilum reptotaenium AO1-A TaxID=1925591 RepID=A0A1L9QM26_9CYAN|nr:NACHT domain-containing protein [Roseofilum reptotaenium]MDB9517440.1 NACHT domain-containing protein [Roseofilum reptotaenium CS-1145]OJJ20711.1 hypothetical protein BI308_20665 [Roseofilum reptotaenium AO1-A]
MSKNSQITLPFITGAANVGLGVCINEVSEQVLDDWNPPTLLVIGIAVLFGVLPFVANAVSERSEEETRTRWVWVAGLSITGFAVASLWMLNQWTVLPDKVTEFLGYATVGLFVFGVLFPPMALLLLALRKGEPVIQAMGTEAIASADSLQQWRENMRTVMNLEVKQWLDNALHDKKKHDRKNGQHQKNSILLKMEDRREQVGQEAKLEIQTPEPVWPLRLRRLWQPFRGQEQQVLDLQERILDIFHKPEIGGRLLILGKPGAGKTTTLLELARDLLEEAQGHTEGQKQPIPVLFEMFRYPGKITIGQWLVEDLQKRHSIPPAHTEAALQRGDLLPLIDGLDEVGLNRQQDCIAQMNRFLREGVPYASRLSLVVCCRQQQYREGEVMLEALNGAVYLQALSGRGGDARGIERSGLSASAGG